MSNPYSSQTVPFTDVGSDFQKLATIQDNLKDTYIDYEATDFLTLRNALVNYIQAVYPTDYNSFAESDLGMVLIELIAYMGSVMSLKSDMLANENFITTAKDINSVRKLFDLVGISLKGPTSAQAQADIYVEGVTSIDNDLILTPAQRVFTVTSPQDGETVSYTLYRQSGGKIDNVNSTGSITFTSSVRSSQTGKYDEGILLEGAFAVETGTFESVGIFNNVTLQESPVIQNSVQVVVSSPETPAADGVYRQVNNLFSASGVNDKVFQVVYNDDYAATLIFGDGSNGVSPPPQSTYTVTYRVGGGSRGNSPNSYINAVNTGTYNSLPVNTRITQTTIGTGGADAESIDHAKKYGPLFYKTQDRIVSLDDYIAYANSFTSQLGTTGKATAVTRKAYSSANVIDLYLLEKASNNQYQKASLSFKNELLTKINEKKMLTDDVVLADGLIRTLDLVMTLSISKEYEGMEGTISTNVANIITNYFLSDNWAFGDSLVLSELNRTVIDVPEVLFSSIDNFSEDEIRVEFNEIIQLNNIDISINLV
tara:strand:- start:4079 stop:5695 length:1617 start_codon:yes stop_codon:yes gene_type:complete